MAPTQVRFLLIVAALLLAAIFTLIGFGVFDSTHPFGWLGAAFVAYFGALLVPAPVATVAATAPG